MSKNIIFIFPYVFWKIQTTYLFFTNNITETYYRRRPKKQQRKKTTKKSIFEVYEPSELKRGFFTDIDNDIRNIDIPERMQLRDNKITPVAEDSTELDEEAEWIYKQVFQKPTISRQEGRDGPDSRTKGPQTVGKIKKALDFMRNQQLEVPFIAFYRKEYVQPELNINDLWKVYKWDSKWAQLRARKLGLLSFFERMRSYQLDQIMSDPDAPIPEHVRVMKDDDFERLKNVQTHEELRDIYNHFCLYYSKEFAAVHAADKLKKKERRAEARRAKRLQQLQDAEEAGQDPPPEDPESDEEPETNMLKFAAMSSNYDMCVKAGISKC